MGNKKITPGLCASVYAPTLGFWVYVPLTEEGIKKEKIRVTQETEKKIQLLIILSEKLKNEQFLEKAPSEIVEREKERELVLQKTIDELKKHLQELS
jgi:valyl-tRNA synthetase